MLVAVKNTLIGSLMDSFVMARYTNTSSTHPTPKPAHTMQAFPSVSMG